MRLWLSHRLRLVNATEFLVEDVCLLHELACGFLHILDSSRRHEIEERICGSHVRDLALA